MADRIELLGLHTLATVGVLDFEQATPQPVVIDLVLDVDLAPAGASDRLEDTVDYGAVCDRAVAIASGPHQLLERLAQAIADEVLRHSAVEAVEVAVRKTRPPVAHHLDTSGVRIVRRRDP